ncbi:hypothetical protein BDN71DRAFT_1506308 [Pleurotus eryngii]|uniref:Uncharacterized protein n=1 Tax=Pleurotus eryngii TaxID=5323 RepID=A0A9P5ZX78_PLEER|nr:hypothetical protein BDN71DRAFT_1506308 [Pleurotus eryngii]
MRPHSQTEVIFQCPQMHSFTLGPASKVSAGHPLTNDPIGHPICPTPTPVFWKYSMFFHVKQVHPQYWDTEANLLCNLPSDFLKALRVTTEEINCIKKLQPIDESAPSYPLINLPFDSNPTGVRHKDPPTADAMLNSSGISSLWKKARLTR